MLAAGEAVFLRAKAEIMLEEAGYEIGTFAYVHEFARRYVPLNSFHTTVMESCHAFLSPKEHAEVLDTIEHQSFFDHYDICRVGRVSHSAALMQARSEYAIVSAACMDPRFYTEYLKHRTGARMSHADALEVVVIEWFTRPS